MCGWCPNLVLATRRDAVFCSQRCRQWAFRARKRQNVTILEGRRLKIAYADPPYPGFAKKLYCDQPSFAGEVDHKDLVLSLSAGYDGWALSTSARALGDILPLCPPQARVCCWVKPIGASPLSFGIHNTWEPVIVVPGRRQRPGKRDWLAAQPARRGGDLPGRKPIAFCMWIFGLLGMQPGDEFTDLFPGTGIVTRAWREVCRSHAGP